jgi:hypothetical protein
MGINAPDPAREPFISTIRANYGEISGVMIAFGGSPPWCQLMAVVAGNGEVLDVLVVNGTHMRKGPKFQKISRSLQLLLVEIGEAHP